MGLLNNYHASKKLRRTNPVKEEADFTHTNSETNTKKTNKRENKTVYIAVTQATGPTSIHNFLRRIGLN